MENQQEKRELGARKADAMIRENILGIPGKNSGYSQETIQNALAGNKRTPLRPKTLELLVERVKALHAQGEITLEIKEKLLSRMMAAQKR